MIKLDFSKEIVIVTGGGSGIGYTVAESFLKANATVLIVGRNPEKLEDAKKKLSKHAKAKSKIHAISADLSSQNEYNKLGQETIDRFGKLDILINSASIWSLTPIEELNDAMLTNYFNNNLKTVMYGAQMARKHMKNGGSIVNLGSFAGLMPLYNSSIYSCCKSAVNTFTRSCAAELAYLNIRANCVIPGVIRTPMTTEYIDKNYEKVIRAIPMNRIGNTQEVANGILFLSSKLASYITGAILEITGGKFAIQL